MFRVDGVVESNLKGSQIHEATLKITKSASTKVDAVD